MKQEIIEKIAADFAELKRLMFGSLLSRMPQDVSPAQCEAFFIVAKAGPVSVKQLAGLLHVSSGAITQLVDGLEQLDLIDRSPDPADRRISLLRLSQAGRAQYTHIKDQHLLRMNEILGSLSEEELLQLRRIVRKIIDSYHPIE